MPRRAPADYELIAQVYEETQSKRETSRRLGLHYNTVDKALRRREGLCRHCGHRPTALGLTVCEECRVFINQREARKREARRAGGLCFICGEPVDAPRSAMYCSEHRLADAARRRKNIREGTRKPPDKTKVRLRNLRNTYGENGVLAWQRDAGTCQACGTVSERRKGMHLHHIDIDKTNNSLENLVVLCSACHFLFHHIVRHPNAGAVIAWATRTYPDFEERFHDFAALLTSTPTGRSA